MKTRIHLAQEVMAIDVGRVALTYEEWLRQLEALRIGYQRGHVTIFPDGSVALPSRPELSIKEYAAFADRIYARGKRIKWGGGEQNKPIDVRAYEAAREYDGDKKKFTKLIAELIEHKDQMHPYTRRYLIERLRAGQHKHEQLAERYRALADQFEV